MFTVDLENDEKPLCEVTFEQGSYAGQTFISGLEPCLVPTCECGSVHTVFKSSDGAETFKAILNVYDDDIEPEFDEDEQTSLLFREELEKEISQENWDDLYKLYYAFKVVSTEVMEPELMLVSFDEEEVEQGIMVSYSHLLPYGLPLDITIDDIVYHIDTYYCIRTHCTCSSLTLAFHAEKEGEEIVNMQSPGISYDYRTGKFELETAGINPLHTPRQLIHSLQTSFPELKKILKNRHERLKELYKAYLKREGLYTKITRKPLALAVPAQPRLAGRNDPCPCGSGKKYKKCCGA